MKIFKSKTLINYEAVNNQTVQYRVRIIGRKYNKFQKMRRCKDNKRKAAQLYEV